MNLKNAFKMAVASLALGFGYTGAGRHHFLHMRSKRRCSNLQLSEHGHRRALQQYVHECERQYLRPVRHYRTGNIQLKL